MTTERIKALEDALRPFSRVAGEMFARNWNRDDVAILFDGECEEIRLIFADFLSAHAALAASQPAPDCHQPDLVTAEAAQPVARLVEAAQWARNRLEKIADDCWHGDARDFKRALIGVFADFDEALANCGSSIPPEIRTVTPALDVQPLTVQDAARDVAYDAFMAERRIIYPGGHIEHNYTSKSAFGAGWAAALRAIAEGLA